MTTSGHTPVLPEETIHLLNPKPGQTAVDCTVGLGGHAAAMARRIGPAGTLIVNDWDGANLARATSRLGELDHPPHIVALRGNFAEIPRKLAEQGLRASVALADLGVASTHLDDPERGFSFSRPGPLDMRMDPDGPTTAADLVNTLSQEELASLLRELGEERSARRIAGKLVAARQAEPILTTARLAHLVREAAGPRRHGDRIDPATRTFQALRIAVNDELGSLDRLLDAVARAARMPDAAPRWLAGAARVGVISFHSLEDRRVKRCFRDLAQAGLGETPNRRPVTPDEAERCANPRSRSAKLRVFRLRAGDPSR